MYFEIISKIDENPNKSHKIKEAVVPTILKLNPSVF